MSHYHSNGGCYATSFHNEACKDCLHADAMQTYSCLNNARSTQIQKYKRYGWQAANIYIINEQEGMLSWLRKTIF